MHKQVLLVLSSIKKQASACFFLINISVTEMLHRSFTLNVAVNGSSQVDEGTHLRSSRERRK